MFMRRLSEEERKRLFEGVDPNGPPMPTEKFKAIWVTHFIDTGKTRQEAEKIVDALCKKYGVK